MRGAFTYRHNSIIHLCILYSANTGRYLCSWACIGANSGRALTRTALHLQLHPAANPLGQQEEMLLETFGIVSSWMGVKACSQINQPWNIPKIKYLFKHICKYLFSIILKTQPPFQTNKTKPEEPQLTNQTKISTITSQPTPESSC